MRTLLDASSYHLAECKFRNLSPRTIESYQHYETVFCTWLQEAGKPLTLHSLNVQNVRECAEWLQARNGERAKRGGQYAKHDFVGVMKLWSRFLVYEDVLEADFLAKLRRPRLVKVARLPFELHEVQAIRGALYQNRTGQRDVAMLALMLDTGIRISELIGLELDDLDLESYRIRVRGKGNKERLLYFGAGERNGGKTTRLLRDYLHHSRRPANKHVTALFLGYQGQPLTVRGWRTIFVAACHEAGIKEAQPHRCRHTFATHYLIRNPHDVEGLRYYLGHLDDDMYRQYSGLAGQIIAQTAGRESLVEVWFSDRPERSDRPPARITPLPTSRGRQAQGTRSQGRRERWHPHNSLRPRLVR